MKKTLFIIASMLLVFAGVAMGQTAKSVLDKCAATISAKEGIQANFTMQSAQYSNVSGTIAVKGKKFRASTPQATMWFDGTTQWTYLKKNNEVSVVTPTEAQLQAINPYNFINMYKKGFKYTMNTTAAAYNVHLTSTNAKRKVQEIFITVDKKSYAPTEVKMLQGQKWTTFTISNLKKASLADDAFRFNSKEFPSAEVIDLR